MAYKVINNILDSHYWVNLIDSPFFFKKVSFSDLFKEIEDETSKEQKDKVKNEIVINTVLNIESIDDILSWSTFEEYSEEIKDEAKEEINPIIKKTIEQQKINTDDSIDPDEKLRELAKKIELLTPPSIKAEYTDKVFSVLWNWWNIKEYVETLSKYKEATNITWYDVWSIAWSINSLFSSYFQSVFVELTQYLPRFSLRDFECDEWSVLKKLSKNQSLELYDMFKFVNWVQENNKIGLIASLKNQENKDKFNLLKSFLETEAYNWLIKWHFYVITLENLRKLRNFHAHHNDERNIEKLMRSSNPDKIKNKFYDKFLWNLDEEWKWFLQYIIERNWDK